MANNVLKMQLTSEQIQSYFESICKIIADGHEEYPVALDDVWPWVYADKGKAVRALKSDFIEDVDYKCFTINGKTETGGYRTTVYYLSVSCLEYFIARKKREIFDVYSRVFHKTHEMLSRPLSPAQMFMQQAKLYLAQEQRMSAMENRMSRIESKVGNSDFVSVLGFANLHQLQIGNQAASAIGRKATRYCREHGIKVEYVHDARHGKVGTYPMEALIEPFQQHYPRFSF